MEEYVFEVCNYGNACYFWPAHPHYAHIAQWVEDKPGISRWVYVNLPQRWQLT